MEATRIQRLNQDAPDDAGAYVLYWMQNSQRASFNPALEHAVGQASELGQGVVVGFGLTEDYPDANERHYAFMLEGLAETAKAVQKRGIKFVLRREAPDTAALDLAKNASLVVCDRGYMRPQRQWRKAVAQRAGKRVVQVEGDVVVPVEAASDKCEFAARTIRPKLQKQWDDYLGEVTERKVATSTVSLSIASDLDVRDPDLVLQALDIDREVKRVSRFIGGTSQARRRLTSFLRGGLSGYNDARNDPSDPQCSNLSPYLHFGQISPVEIARKVLAAGGAGEEDGAAFLEELIVRRELAINFVFFNDDYDRFAGLPDWAKKTLAEHEDDERPKRYTRAELEAAETADPYWNAAMIEMRKTGYMHNYMRMYWGKKILEWCNTPSYAFSTTLYLNNKYFIDGRDPNSFTGVAWIFGLHDRPWTERSVFGKVRYMNASGLERKFDIQAYVDWVESL